MYVCMYVAKSKKFVSTLQDSRTLPALAVRSAVYQMLLNQIHPSAEQLKKTRGRGLGQCTAPIGEVIVALRKHKLETPENKKLLKVTSVIICFGNHM
jgi:hypothetical protein